MNIYLTPGTHDLDVTGNKMRFTTTLLEETRQQLATQLQVFLGEWFLDTTLGVPYYRDILVKNPVLDVIRNIFRKKILDNPNVESVPRLDLDLDSNRELSVSFDAVLIDSSVATVELPVAEPDIEIGNIVIDSFGDTVVDGSGNTVIYG